MSENGPDLGDYEQQRAKNETQLRELNFSYDDLLRFAAGAVTDESRQEKIIEYLLDHLHQMELALSVISEEGKKLNLRQQKHILEMYSASKNLAAGKLLLGIIQGEKHQKIAQAKLAATARHSKPGGSRDKKQKIRELWASGKYTTRDICAEQECAALGMSFSAARRALRNIPDPT